MSARVLIIDDDSAIRDMLALYLRSQGFQTSIAPDGASGIEACLASPPDLVMCDLRMPGIDGLGVLAALGEAHPELPVIIVSGTAELGDAVQALKLGAWDYVTKPILDLGVLDHAIRKALERARLIAENRAYRDRLEAANARLESSLRQLQEDEEAGRRIQFTLLPPPAARFGEFECSRFLKTSSFLSGDFADYFAIDGGRFAFYMADVSGHGVSSAVITVMLKSLIGRYLDNLRRYGDATLLDPAALLGALNREVLDGRHGKYLTMFYGVIDPAEGHLRYANGGQFPFPWLFDGRALRSVGERSPPVGLFADAHFAPHELALPARFSLQIFSDGVLELLPGDSLAARKALLERVAAGDACDAEGLARELGIDSEAIAPDDASILCLRRI